MISIARFMARSDGKKGRTPCDGPNKSTERGSRTSCKKKTTKAQFHGQSNFPETGRQAGKKHWTRKKTNVLTRTPGYLFSVGTNRNAITTTTNATRDHAREPVNHSVALRLLIIRAPRRRSGNIRFNVEVVSISMQGHSPMRLGGGKGRVRSWLLHTLDRRKLPSPRLPTLELARKQVSSEQPQAANQTRNATT